MIIPLKYSYKDYMVNKADIRRQSQLAFLESEEEIEVGNLKNLPMELEELKKIDQHSKYVEEYFDSGLTADVFRINIDGTCWTLKKKRKNILVKNIDGQTSFLNEVQRRSDFQKLKALNSEDYAGIVDTTYASLKNEIILSPWIEGNSAKRFSKEIIGDLYNTLFHVEIAGLFECDLCSGNLLVQDDGKVRIFDFGYMYPFNPLSEYNSDGKALPIFHGVERFETRCYMQYLMDIEEEISLNTALQEFKVEKIEALKYYTRKKEWMIANRADDDLINWIDEFIRLWEEGLSDQNKLSQLYDLESFRSYVLDVHDDIGGKSCTPDTLSKINKIIEKIQTNYEYLKAHRGLFWGDESLDPFQLLEKYSHMMSLVEDYQIVNLDGFNKWKLGRLESIRNSFELI